MSGGLGHNACLTEGGKGPTTAFAPSPSPKTNDTSPKRNATGEVTRRKQPDGLKWRGVRGLEVVPRPLVRHCVAITGQRGPWKVKTTERPRGTPVPSKGGHPLCKATAALAERTLRCPRGCRNERKKNTRSVQYALRWRLVCNRWRLVGNRWRLAGSDQTSESGCHSKNKRVSVLIAPPAMPTPTVGRQRGPIPCPSSCGITHQVQTAGGRPQMWSVGVSALGSGRACPTAVIAFCPSASFLRSAECPASASLSRDPASAGYSGPLDFCGEACIPVGGHPLPPVLLWSLDPFGHT